MVKDDVDGEMDEAKVKLKVQKRDKMSAARVVGLTKCGADSSAEKQLDQVIV